MPEITFRKEVTQEQYDLLQTVLKLWGISQEELVWEAIVGDLQYRIEAAEDSPLYEKSGLKGYFDEPETKESNDKEAS